jgi:hypothetical protein
MVVVLILLLLVALCLGVIRAVLRGTLTLDRVGEPSGKVLLPAAPWKISPADDLIGVPGRIFIAGIPFTRRMHIWIRCPGRPSGDGTLRQGGRRYISGVWVTHDAAVAEDDPLHGIDLDSAEL